MAANDTPIPDLVELSSINANATFTVTPGGGGDIIGVVDNATYSDSDGSNSSSQLAELNDDGILTIDGVDYTIQLAVPDSGSDDVTVTYNNGASTTDLAGDGFDSQIVFITASPLGGGSDRYFAAIDDGLGNLPNITSIQIRDLDFDPAGNDVKINLDQNQNVAPVCFTSGTLILTPRGEIPVETLQAGNEVLTVDAGAQPIRWIGRRDMTFTPETKQHKPIQIKAGVLGNGLPVRDIAVSPQHRMVFAGPVVQRLFDTDQVLARAKGLTGLPGVRVMKGKKDATYITLLLNQHHVITAEGALSESFFPGPTALRMLPRVQRAEIEAIFPRLRDDPDTGYGSPSHRVLTLQESKSLADGWKQTPRKIARNAELLGNVVTLGLGTS